jgi:hypothetical protein
MAGQEAVRKMMLAHRRGEAAAFDSAARDFIAEQRRLKHHTTANDLERILGNGQEPVNGGSVLSLLGPVLAGDWRRGASPR